MPPQEAVGDGRGNSPTFGSITEHGGAGGEDVSSSLFHSSKLLQAMNSSSGSLWTSPTNKAAPATGKNSSHNKPLNRRGSTGTVTSAYTTRTEAGRDRTADKRVEAQLVDAIGKTCLKFFGPVSLVRPVQERLPRLSVQHLDNYVRIKEAYEQECADRQAPQAPPLLPPCTDNGSVPGTPRPGPSPATSLPEDMVLRASMARGFDVEATLEMLRRMETRYWDPSLATARRLEKDLRSGAVVPLPFLRTAVSNDVVYFAPHKLSGERGTTAGAVQIMTYALNAVYERHRSSKRRICVLVNLKDWKYDKHFRLDAWMAWMDVWQGRLGPVRASQVLIVHASDDFIKRAWNMCKTMCQGNYASRVHFLESEQALGEYLTTESFQECLPDEFESGSVPTGRLVRDFLRYRITLERLVNKLAGGHQGDSFSPLPQTPLPPQTPSQATPSSSNRYTPSRSKSADDAPAATATTLPSAPLQSPRRRQLAHRPASSRRAQLSRNISVPCLQRPSQEFSEPRQQQEDAHEDDALQEIESDDDSDSSSNSSDGMDHSDLDVSESGHFTDGGGDSEYESDAPTRRGRTLTESSSGDLSVRVRRPSMDEEFLQFDVAALVAASKDSGDYDDDDEDDKVGATKDDDKVNKDNVNAFRKKTSERSSESIRKRVSRRASRRASTTKSSSKDPEQPMPPSSKKPNLQANRRNRFLRATSAMGLSRAVSFRATRTSGGHDASSSDDMPGDKSSGSIRPDDGGDDQQQDEDGGGAKKKGGGRGLLQNMKARFQSRRQVLGRRDSSGCMADHHNNNGDDDAFEYDNEQDDDLIASTHRRGKGFRMMG